MRITESRLRRVIKEVVSEISRPVSKKRQAKYPASNPLLDGEEYYIDETGERHKISYEVTGKDGDCVLTIIADLEGSYRDYRREAKFVHGIIRRVMDKRFKQKKQAMSSEESYFVFREASVDDVGKIGDACVKQACAEITDILKYMGFND